jgi:hypothetical protein
MIDISKYEMARYYYDNAKAEYETTKNELAQEKNMLINSMLVAGVKELELNSDVTLKIWTKKVPILDVRFMGASQQYREVHELVEVKHIKKECLNKV